MKFLKMFVLATVVSLLVVSGAFALGAWQSDSMEWGGISDGTCFQSTIPALGDDEYEVVAAGYSPAPGAELIVAFYDCSDTMIASHPYALDANGLAVFRVQAPPGAVRSECWIEESSIRLAECFADAP